METTISNTTRDGTLPFPETHAVGTTETTQAVERSHAALDRAAQGIHEAVERVAAKAVSMADGVADATADSQSPEFAKFDDLLNSEWAEAARNEVREHPLTVVGIALIAGLVIGRL